jgi:hypothetical protein
MSRVEDLKNRLESIKKEKENGTRLCLPSDTSYSIPSPPLDWLMQYGLTEREIIQNKIGWSKEKNSLVFPIYDPYGNLKLFQLRKFPEKVFYMWGEKEGVDFILGNQTEKYVVVVEDYISTLKVGRQIPTCCLWGSSLSLERIRRLAGRYSSLLIWLDRDKTAYAGKVRVKAGFYFDTVRIIVTDEDPKTYPDTIVKQILSDVSVEVGSSAAGYNDGSPSCSLDLSRMGT